MKPGAGPVTATRSIKKELKTILDENRDKEYLKNHEHAGAIKTKSLNGKALPMIKVFCLLRLLYVYDVVINKERDQ